MILVKTTHFLDCLHGEYSFVFLVSLEPKVTPQLCLMSEFTGRELILAMFNKPSNDWIVLQSYDSKSDLRIRKNYLEKKGWCGAFLNVEYGGNNHRLIHSVVSSDGVERKWWQIVSIISTSCTHLHRGRQIYLCGLCDVGLGVNLAQSISQLWVLG